MTFDALRSLLAAGPGLVRAIVLVFVALAAPAAFAQFGMGGGDMGMDQTKITRRGVENYARLLGLDEDQREVAMTLLEGNQSAHRELMDQMNEAMRVIREKVEDTQDFSLFQKEIPKVAADFTKKAEALEKSFFDDLKGVLTPEQTDRWPRVERARRREQGMRFGFASGQAVDIVAVVERTKVTPTDPAELDAILQQYEVDVDRHLQTLETMGKEARDDMLGSGSMFDMNKMQESMKKFYDVAKSIRDTNRDFARRASGLMDEPSRARFEAEVARRSFPRIYKPGHTQKMLEAAAGFSDLSEDQKQQVTALRESYTRDCVAANERWSKAQEEREEQVGGTIMVMMQSITGGGGAGSEEVNKARDARRELDQKTADRLKELLSADQVTRLPARPKSSGNPWQDFMSDFDAEEDEPLK